MKKHQLLEKAMRDYPAGTVVRFKSEPRVDHVSDGTFRIMENTGNGTAVVDQTGTNCFYCSIGDEWAIPVAPIILSGKVAVQVSNERELDSVNKHNNTTWQPQHNYGFPAYLYLCSGRGFDTDPEVVTRNGFKIIPFADFTAEVGIKVPVKIMTSEDGVDLYEGDGCFTALKTDGIWFLDRHYGEGEDFNRFEVADNGMFASTDDERQFSTKEAAESWIKEQNKPKSTAVKLFHGGTAEVYIDHLCIHGGIKLTPSDLEDMLHAYKSLQQ